MDTLSPLFKGISDERMLRFTVAEDFLLLGEGMFLSATELELNSELEVTQIECRTSGVLNVFYGFCRNSRLHHTFLRLPRGEDWY